MSKGNRLMLLLLLACAASPAHATFSVGYRGIGVLSNAGSSGIVAAIHPNQSAWGLALSVNGTTLDSKTLILDSKSVTAEKNNITLSKAQITRQFVEAQLRIYPYRSSFFWAIGAISGRTKGNFVAQEADGGLSLTKDYDYQAIMASVTIGNIWTFGPFMIGAEWIGFTASLSKKLSTTPATPATSPHYPGVVGDAEHEFDNLLKYYGVYGGLTALLLHIGVDI